MRFLTWANDPSDPRCDLLFASAKHFGIEVEPIGVGKEYRGGVSKIEWLHYWLAQQESDDVICCTDAYDCLYLKATKGIDDTWEDFAIRDNYVIYAGERWYRK